MSPPPPGPRPHRAPDVGAVLHVAFFRNLNLGQGWSPPTGAALEEPFLAVGATWVRSFQSNGTVAFDPGGRRATDVAVAVGRRLAEATGYVDLCVVQPASELALLVSELATTAAPHDMVTFFTGDERAALDGVDVLGRGPGWVVTTFDQTPRNPSRDVLAAIGSRATARTFGTVTRLGRTLGLGEPGRRVDDATAPALPDDLAAALTAAGLMVQWGHTPPGRRLTFLTWVESARRPDTRRRRIDGVAQRLRGH